MAVVGELDLEGKLFPRVAAGVVYPLSPDGERAQRLKMGRVAPPAVLQRGQCVRVAGVRIHDGAPHEAAPLAAASVWLKPGWAPVALGRLGVVVLGVVVGVLRTGRSVRLRVGDCLADHVRRDFCGWLARSARQLVEFLRQGFRQRDLDASARQSLLTALQAQVETEREMTRDDPTLRGAEKQIACARRRVADIEQFLALAGATLAELD